MTTDEIMVLVEAYAAECAEYEAPTISPRYSEIQAAIDALLADNASLREQNTALDGAVAELDRANLLFAKRELWWNEKMFALEEKLKWAHHTPKLLSDADAAADLAGVARPGAGPVAWHNPVATAVRDSMTGQVQLEYIGHFPADELVRLYAAPQPHHIDLVNVAVAVRDACHRAWVTSAENWRSDVDVRQIVRDTTPPQASQPVAWLRDTGKKIRITQMDMRDEDGWRPLFYSIWDVQKGKP